MMNKIFGKHKRRALYLPMTIMLLLSLLLGSGITFAQDEVPPETPVEEPTAPVEEPTQEPIVPSDPTKDPVEDPTEEPAPPSDPTEEPALPPDPTEKPDLTPEPFEEPRRAPDIDLAAELDMSWEYSVDFDTGISTAGLRSSLIDRGLDAKLTSISNGKTRMIVSGSGGLAQLRTLLNDDLDGMLWLIGGPAEVNIKLPVSKTQPILIKLEGNLSTGFGWEVLQATNNTAGMKTSHAYSHRGGRGTPELNTIKLIPTARGEGQVKLVYRQPFEKNAPITRRLNLNLSTSVGVIDLSDPNPPVVEEGLYQSGENPIADIPLKTLPAAWDWRTKGIVPPIRPTQGTCGSCWAFGTVGVMESAIKKSGGPLVDLSEQFLISCNKDNWSCSGGLTAHKYHYNTLGKNQTTVGAVLESVKPYTMSNGTCGTTNYNKPYKLSNWKFVTGSEWTMPTVNQIKNAIYTYGPITAGICAGSLFQNYSGGIFKTTEDVCSGSTNHQIILVGWNDTGGYWILRNSYGTSWGENGYMRIKWGTSRVGEGTSWVTRSSTVVPTTISPTGTIYTTKPTYKWTRTANTTKYQVQVYRGTTKVMDFVRNSTACTGNTCQTTPTTGLTYAVHKWRVRAYVNGAWKAFSPFRSFTVKKPSSGFNSTFNGSFTGWVKNPGAAWKIYSGKYYGTAGALGKLSSTRYKTAYSNFDYSARVRRIGGISGTTMPMNGLMVRMGSSFKSTDNMWYPGYLFAYYDLGNLYGTGGYWAIWQRNSNGTSTLLYNGSTSSIAKNSWNTLRVVASGTNLKFYINGTLIRSFTNSSRASGTVGLDMYRITGTTTTFYADWAKLTKLTTSYVNTDEVDLKQQALDQAALDALYDMEFDPETLSLRLIPKK